MNEKSKTQTILLSAFLQETFQVINEVGQSYNRYKVSEIGEVKYTYLAIIEKVARNIDGIIILLESNRESLKNNRQPVMLLLRSIIDDLFVGMYLYRLKDDEISFKNELHVIELQFAKFSEFLIIREPHLQSSKEYKGLSSIELENLVKEKILSFRERHAHLYKTDKDGNVVFKKPVELRSSSNKSHLLLKDSAGVLKDMNGNNYTVSLLHDIVEYIGIETHELLKIYQFAYLVYRALSQYQHFSLHVTVETLNRDEEFELDLIKQATGAFYGLLIHQLHFLEATENQFTRLQEMHQKYMFER